jgi:fatty acid-binding protein DegV
MIATMGNRINDTIMISHGDVLEEAQYVASLIKEKISTVQEVIIEYICPSIGAHAGPGTIALFFEAEVR